MFQGFELRLAYRIALVYFFGRIFGGRIFFSPRKMKVWEESREIKLYDCGIGGLK